MDPPAQPVASYHRRYRIAISWTLGCQAFSGVGQADGRSFAIVLVALSTGAGIAAFGISSVERRWHVPRIARRGFVVALVALTAIGSVAVVKQFGTPWAISTRIADRFAGPPLGSGQDLDARLFDASSNGRIDLWRTAWNDARRHPLAGSGAGSYAAEWARERPIEFDSTNAHMLYLETLAELGPIGLGLLVAALGAPLVAARRAGSTPLRSELRQPMSPFSCIWRRTGTGNSLPSD